MAKNFEQLLLDLKDSNKSSAKERLDEMKNSREAAKDLQIQTVNLLKDNVEELKGIKKVLSTSAENDNKQSGGFQLPKLLSNPLKGIQQGFKNLGKKIIDPIQAPFRAIGNLKDTFTSGLKNIGESVTKVGGFFKATALGITQPLERAITGLFSGISNFLGFGKAVLSPEVAALREIQEILLTSSEIRESSAEELRSQQADEVRVREAQLETIGDYILDQNGILQSNLNNINKLFDEQNRLFQLQSILNEERTDPVVVDASGQIVPPPAIPTSADYEPEPLELDFSGQQDLPGIAPGVASENQREAEDAQATQTNFLDQLKGSSAEQQDDLEELLKIEREESKREKKGGILGKIVGGISGFMTSIGLLITGQTTLIGAFPIIGKLITGFKGAVTGFSKAFLPIAITIGVIGGLFKSIVSLFKGESFSEILKSFFIGFYDAAIGGFIKVFAQIQGVMLRLLGLGEFADEVIQIFDKLNTFLRTLVGGLFDMFKAIFTGDFTLFKEAFFNVLKSFGSTLVAFLKTFLVNIGPMLIKLTGNVLKLLAGLIIFLGKTLFNMVTFPLRLLGETIFNALMFIPRKILEVLANFTQGLIDGVSNIFTLIIDGIASIGGYLARFPLAVAAAIGALVPGGRTPLEAFTETIQGGSGKKEKKSKDERKLEKATLKRQETEKAVEDFQGATGLGGPASFTMKYDPQDVFQEYGEKVYDDPMIQKIFKRLKSDRGEARFQEDKLKDKVTGTTDAEKIDFLKRRGIELSGLTYGDGVVNPKTGQMEYNFQGSVSGAELNQKIDEALAPTPKVKQPGFLKQLGAELPALKDIMLGPLKTFGRIGKGLFDNATFIPRKIIEAGASSMMPMVTPSTAGAQIEAMQKANLDAKQDGISSTTVQTNSNPVTNNSMSSTVVNNTVTPDRDSTFYQFGMPMSRLGY